MAAVITGAALVAGAAGARISGERRSLEHLPALADWALVALLVRVVTLFLAGGGSAGAWILAGGLGCVALALRPAADVAAVAPLPAAAPAAPKPVPATLAWADDEPAATPPVPRRGSLWAEPR